MTVVFVSGNTEFTSTSFRQSSGLEFFPRSIVKEPRLFHNTGSHGLFPGLVLAVVACIAQVAYAKPMYRLAGRQSR